VIVGVFNFTPVPRSNYQIGIPQAGRWLELLNSDAPLYGGQRTGEPGWRGAVPISMHGPPAQPDPDPPTARCALPETAPGDGGLIVSQLN